MTHPCPKRRHYQKLTHSHSVQSSLTLTLNQLTPMRDASHERRIGVDSVLRPRMSVDAFVEGGYDVRPRADAVNVTPALLPVS